MGQRLCETQANTGRAQATIPRPELRARVELGGSQQMRIGIANAQPEESVIADKAKDLILGRH